MVAIAPTDARIAKSGFAKIVLLEPGKPQLDIYVQKYEVSVGRRNKKEQLDVAVDESNAQVSRLHARIFYDFQLKTWRMEALGKNGITVDDELYTPLPKDTPVAGHKSVATLKSQTRIEVGDAVLWFLLPEKRKLKFLEIDYSQPRVLQFTAPAAQGTAAASTPAADGGAGSGRPSEQRGQGEERPGTVTAHAPDPKAGSAHDHDDQIMGSDDE